MNDIELLWTILTCADGEDETLQDEKE